MRKVTVKLEITSYQAAIYQRGHKSDMKLLFIN